MSINRYFKGNFGIFITDYHVLSVDFIYDYAMWKAEQENRNVIVVCTSKEKYEAWKKRMSLYDFKGLLKLREMHEGLYYLEDISEFYLDNIHLSNIIIIDGVPDLIYGDQSLHSISFDALKAHWLCRTSDKQHPPKDWDKYIQGYDQLYYRDPEKLLEQMDNNPENTILLIAEFTGKEITLEHVKEQYPDLIKHGDGVIGIVRKNDYTNIIPLINRNRKLRDIREEKKLSIEFHEGFHCARRGMFLRGL